VNPKISALTPDSWLIVSGWRSTSPIDAYPNSRSFLASLIPDFERDGMHSMIRAFRHEDTDVIRGQDGPELPE
jgi:hypothetical protein